MTDATLPVHDEPIAWESALSETIPPGIRIIQSHVSAADLQRLKHPLASPNMVDLPPLRASFDVRDDTLVPRVIR